MAVSRISSMIALSVLIVALLSQRCGAASTTPTTVSTTVKTMTPKPSTSSSVTMTTVKSTTTNSSPGPVMFSVSLLVGAAIVALKIRN